MKAVILAAGKGTRMLPLTENIPKVLISIAGKPFLWYLLKNLQKAGINEFGMIVGYKQEKIKEFVAELSIENVTFLEQKEQLGTGHALMQAKEFAGNKKFLVISGDNLYSAEDIKQIANGEANIIAGFEVKNPSAYGVLITEAQAEQVQLGPIESHSIRGEKLVRIDEKPENPVSNLINTGLYLFGPEIFEKLIQVGKSERGEYELTDAMTALAQENKMSIYKLKDYWIDLGKKEDIPIVESQIKQLFSSQV